ncbi:MAG: hypothetical protein EOO24_07040 [Comamonadaceae bacterium]|nr:MAG: hypothetical protein EOO24_07040 [Comamonadaceae bacterium]
MEAQERYSHIPGWGVDLDRANRPACPRERTPPRLEGVHWTEPGQQQPRVEILHSTERDGITPIFGTGAPPRGVSGHIRRYAFGFSENDLRHWLLLLAADRVDVGEGIVEDLKRGHVPRLYAEMGGRAELRHNPMGTVRKGLLLGALVGLCYTRLKSRRSVGSGRAGSR